MAETAPIIITARYSTGTYIARHASKVGSSTAGHEQAVRLVAAKVWGEGAGAELVPLTFVETGRYPYVVVLTEKASKASTYVIEVYGCASPTWVSESSDESPEELSITTDPQLAARFDRLAEAHGTCSKLAKRHRGHSFRTMPSHLSAGLVGHD